MPGGLPGRLVPFGTMARQAESPAALGLGVVVDALR